MNPAMPVPPASNESVADPEHDDPLAGSSQLLLVVADHWHGSAGTWRRFERKAADAAWIVVGPPVAVSLGRNGLGWGIGLQGKVAGRQDPVKCEGDGRSPAGVFRLSDVFGDATALPQIAGRARLPYWPVTAELKCIDDAASPYYNQFVDTRQVDIGTWSHEAMLRDDGQYAVGVFVAHNVAHNAEPPVAGAGSCIFIHVWREPGAPTAGCTAATVDDVVTLFGWLDAARQPLLVQLPHDEYLRQRSRWHLP